jgi:hypothetical protein
MNINKLIRRLSGAKSNRDVPAAARGTHPNVNEGRRNGSLPEPQLGAGHLMILR